MNLSKKFIIVSTIAIFVVAPLFAIGLDITLKSINAKPPQPYSKADMLQDLKSKINQKNNQVDEDTNIRVESVESYTKFGDWWYIIYANISSDDKSYPKPTPILAAKYPSVDKENGDKDDDTFQIFAKPNELMPQANISGSLGVPYDIVDAYETAINTSWKSPEKESGK